MMDDMGAPKEATTDENNEVVHSLVMLQEANLRDIVNEVGISFGAVNAYRHLRNVKGLGKMGPQNVDRRS